MRTRNQNFGQQIIIFELTSTLADGAGEQATAKLVLYSDKDEGWITHGAEDFLTVYNGPVDSFEGSSGDRGYAFYEASSRRWLVFQMNCPEA